MLVTASTVKDTLPNLQRFVARNLAGGVDHLVVFLDAGDPPVRAWLDEHPHVTCVRTDAHWWCGDRPEQLNVRQRINANVVRSLMTVLDPDGWTCHVDADEVVQVDRPRLDELGREVEVVRMAPLEAVSRQHWEGEVTHFKRLLPKDDLTLLATLGVIDKPHNKTYFHGHVTGKCAMRPSLERWHGLHNVVDADRQPLEPHSPAWAQVLHYESYSGEDFVRKWTSILAAGPLASFRPNREPTAVALRALIAKDLTEEQARSYLMRIFERTTEDDFETLRDLGLLEQRDPDRGAHTPEPLGDERRAALDTMLAGLSGQAKRLFHPGNPSAPVAQLVRRLAADAGRECPAPAGGPASRGARSEGQDGRSRLPWRR